MSGSEAAEELPREVAVYVNDVCCGAQVVEDSLCQICAYIMEEEQGEEVEFAFWYDERSEVEKRNTYKVYNENSKEYESRSLIIGMPGIHYKVSFNDKNYEIQPVLHNLHCYPNPFNPELTISFDLEKEQKVKLEIYNVRGQKIKTLIDKALRKNNYNLVWKGDNQTGKKVSSGIYFIKLHTEQQTITSKAILMK